jgi:deoxycytidylate deaminase
MPALIKRNVTTRKSHQRGATSRALIREHASNELIFAVVGHVGAGTTEVAKKLKDALENPSLKGGRFDVTILKARDAIKAWATLRAMPLPLGPDKDINNTIAFQNLGDEMRKEDHASVGSALVARIRVTRAQKQGTDAVEDEAVVPDGGRRAYILDSIRHPAEVHLLRSVYQNAFTLIGVVCEEDVRLQRLVKKYTNAGEESARQFMKRDAHAEEKYGQRVSDAFHLADVFLDNTQPQMLKGKSNKLWTISDQLARIVKLITHDEVVRPTAAESAMYAAFGAQLRSSCLSRQVGAAVADVTGTVISTGTNEAPCAGGGVYLEPIPGNPSQADGRCAFRPGTKFCSNIREQNEIIHNMVEDTPILSVLPNRDILEKQLRDSRIGNLIEFSRAVHAEMDALLSAARRGIAVAGTKLFVTTFPCHYCARHVVAAGIDEVQFIEPYPKSQALKLHNDSITMDLGEWKPPSEGGTHVLFRPYTGVAPRMYERAFIKDRPLKNAETGDYEVGDPDWGSAWDLVKISYPQLEVQLTKHVEEPHAQAPSK